jgi:hypothetical protein
VLLEGGLLDACRGAHLRDGGRRVRFFVEPDRSLDELFLFSEGVRVGNRAGDAWGRRRTRFLLYQICLQDSGMNGRRCGGKIRPHVHTSRLPYPNGACGVRITHQRDGFSEVGAWEVWTPRMHGRNGGSASTLPFLHASTPHCGTPVALSVSG